MSAGHRSKHSTVLLHIVSSSNSCTNLLAWGRVCTEAKPPCGETKGDVRLVWIMISSGVPLPSPTTQDLHAARGNEELSRTAGATRAGLLGRGGTGRLLDAPPAGRGSWQGHTYQVLPGNWNISLVLFLSLFFKNKKIPLTHSGAKIITMRE